MESDSSPSSICPRALLPGPLLGPKERWDTGACLRNWVWSDPPSADIPRIGVVTAVSFVTLRHHFLTYTTDFKKHLLKQATKLC